MHVSDFLMTVYPLITRFNGSVTSWYRTVKHNAQVGGDPNSRHLYGLAIDVVLDNDIDKERFISECRKRFGLAAVDEGDHVHVQVV